MPLSAAFVVVVVREPGLRSLLTARLTLRGASVVTAGDVADPAIARALRRHKGSRPLLVIDRDMANDGPANWLSTLTQSAEPCGVVVVTPDRRMSLTSEFGLTYVNQHNAFATIVSILETAGFGG